MKNRLKWLIPLILIIVITAVYLWPVSEPSFEELYADVDQETVDSLVAFRTAYPTKTVFVNDKPWEYLALGQGENTIVFLHGMTGAYDIWWQQMEVLREQYRVISMTYPAAENLVQI